MGREIVTARDVLRADPERSVDSVQSKKIDGYFDKLVKYLPAEFVALYVTCLNIARLQQKLTADTQGVIAALLLVLLPLYMWRVLRVRKVLQIALSTVAAIVWVGALGGPVIEGLVASSPGLALALALAVPVSTFVLPIIRPGD